MDNNELHCYKIAIIIPAYNEEKTLPDCIESLVSAINYLKETIKFQLTTVICENGSVDRTLKVAYVLKSKFPSLHIEVLRSDKGMIKAERTMIRILPKDVDFIFKIDADILLKEDSLSIIVKEFIKHRELKIVGGHPKPLSYKGGNFYKRWLDKFLNVRSYFPQSEISKYDVKIYHPLAFSDPQPTVPSHFEIKSKIYFHGRFFCTRGRAVWDLIRGDDRKIGEDVFLTNAVYEQFGLKAIRVRYDAICFSHTITSFFDHYRVYARIWQDKKRVYREYPQFSKYKRLCKTKLDWNYIFSLPGKWVICFIIYSLIKNFEELIFRFFVADDKDYWRYSSKKLALLNF